MFDGTLGINYFWQIYFELKSAFNQPYSFVNHPSEVEQIGRGVKRLVDSTLNRVRGNIILAKMPPQQIQLST